MHKSKILAILIVGIFVSSVGAAPLLMTYKDGSQTTEAEVIESASPTSPPNRMNYKKFLDSIVNLENQISHLPKVSDRISYLHKRLEEIEAERNKWDYSVVEDEIAMDMIIGVLHEIPIPDQFNSNECATYQTNIFVGYDPTSSSFGEPREPSVKKAFGIFKKICN